MTVSLSFSARADVRFLESRDSFLIRRCGSLIGNEFERIDSFGFYVFGMKLEPRASLCLGRLGFEDSVFP